MLEWHKMINYFLEKNCATKYFIKTIKRNDSISAKSNMHLCFQEYIQLYIGKKLLLYAENCTCEDLELQ